MKGRKAWEKSGGLSKVPGDPSHDSIELRNVQVLGNRVCRLLQDVCRGSYRKLRISTGSLLTFTGCSVVGVLGDGGVKELYGWIGKMKEELVMAYGQRDEMGKVCVKLVGLEEGSSSGRSKRLSNADGRRVGRQMS